MSNVKRKIQAEEPTTERFTKGKLAASAKDQFIAAREAAQTEQA